MEPILAAFSVPAQRENNPMEMAGSSVLLGQGMITGISGRGRSFAGPCPPCSVNELTGNRHCAQGTWRCGHGHLGSALEGRALDTNWASSLGNVGPLVSLAGSNNMARSQKPYFSVSSEIQRCPENPGRKNII